MPSFISFAEGETDVSEATDIISDRFFPIRFVLCLDGTSRSQTLGWRKIFRQQSELPAKRSSAQFAPANPAVTAVSCDTWGRSEAVWRNAGRTPHGRTHRFPALREYAQLGWTRPFRYSCLRRASLFPFPVFEGKANGDSGSRAGGIQHRARFSGGLGFCRIRLQTPSGNVSAC